MTGVPVYIALNCTKNLALKQNFMFYAPEFELMTRAAKLHFSNQQYDGPSP